jgi:Tfp pilus assembly protein PilO
MATKKLILIVVILVVVVAYYILGTGYLKGKRQNAALAVDIEETTQLLLEIPSPPTDLEERLEAVRTELDSTLNRLPAETNTTKIINYILQLGESSGVKVIPIITKSWETEDYDGYEISVFRLNLSVHGTSYQFRQFLSSLECAEFETLIIQNLQINRHDDSLYLKSISSGSVEVHTDIQLAVYGRISGNIMSEWNQ